ncbi:NAD-dependent malic enzyme [Pontibacillus marinus]|uniref:NAD-dependent malic enzyme n=1 Tax=Pontibacillus marinus BH030004 = DSM 16465 TaxID=1385511 RepID=A0A0A5G7Z4_9BACI|nr:NAD-dependent malic enzyme [Pontibacillus marinus]KGX89261.1 NAD-dependent malic enzyme [Pontibacillus marinus BH030004 = DSM 16465]
MSRAMMSIILRLEMEKENVSFGEIATIVSNVGGDIVAIDVIKEGKHKTIRDISINVNDETKQERIIQSIKQLPGVVIKHISDRTFLVHLGGKIHVSSKVEIDNREEMSRVYTPEVARVCEAIDEDPNLAYQFTIKRNTVAVISDGTAVLGLGTIRPEAAMPVMEGKAMLFKQFANVDAFPICINPCKPEETIRIVKALSPTFGGINLEDIGSPQCFEIEERLKQELDIPVFHDDQHGTAIVALAGLLNALHIVNKDIASCKIIVCGIGAAGMAITNMLLTAGATNIIGVDMEGALTRDLSYDRPGWNEFAGKTNPQKETGALHDVIKDADVFIGVSAPGILKNENIQSMANDPIVFALANPHPEITPDEARPYAKVMATGRSDYPNQVNNVLCFPGIFRGALDCRAREINEEMKLAAAKAIASTISEDEVNEDYIIPSVFNEDVVQSIRNAVIKAAIETGVARRNPDQ